MLTQAAVCIPILPPNASITSPKKNPPINMPNLLAEMGMFRNNNKYGMGLIHQAMFTS
jgi:hypothetical protein